MDFFTDLMGLILLIVCILIISLLLTIRILVVCVLIITLLTISCIHLRYSLCIFVCSVLHKRICNNSKSKYLKKDV